MYIVLFRLVCSRCIYIYIYIVVHFTYSTNSITVSFQISNLFLRPRPWQFEIRDSTDT